jgi:predicted outer membrane repeat protein
VYFGGGISGFNLTLTNSTVSGNTASIYHGGGIYGDYSTLTNSTVSGNTASRGGGIYGDNLTLTNSTVSGNTAYSGGGIYGARLGPVYVGNSIVEANSATGVIEPIFPNCQGGLNSLGYNLTDDTTCGFTEPGDLVVADALLYPLGNFGGPTKTHHPMTGSPAIDAANNASCPLTDQRGEARPFDGDDPPDGFADCDIGSVEFVPEPHHTATMLAGAVLLALLYRRRARGLRRASRC